MLHYHRESAFVAAGISFAVFDGWSSRDIGLLGSLADSPNALAEDVEQERNRDHSDCDEA